jgi:hypothetical protein
MRCKLIRREYHEKAGNGFISIDTGILRVCRLLRAKYLH